MNLQELMQKHAGLCDQQEIIVNKAVTEGRPMSAEEQTQFNTLQTEIDGLAATIEAASAVQVRADALEQPAAGTPRPHIVVGKNREADKPWNRMGEFFQAVYAAGQPGATADPRLVYQAAASGLSVNIPSDGGWLVGKQLEDELLRLTHDAAQIAPKCLKIPIGDGFDGLQINVVDETSRANGSRWGGIVVYRRAEADVATASKPKFRKLELSLEDMVGLCYATDRSLRDASVLERIIKLGFSEEFAFKLDDEIITGVGSGSGQCLGILNSPCLVTVAKETGQAARTVVYENIVKMWARMWARSRNNAVWLINQDIEPQLHTMNLSVGTGGVPVYMPAGGASAAPFATLYGRPIIPIEQCSTLGTVGDIILADFSQYLLIDKDVLEAVSSIHVRFIYGENTFRFTYPVNGQPVWYSALTPKNGTNTLSPFVALATRA